MRKNELFVTYCTLVCLMFSGEGQNTSRAKKLSNNTTKTTVFTNQDGIEGNQFLIITTIWTRLERF